MTTKKKLGKTVIWILWNCAFGLGAFLIVLLLTYLTTGSFDLRNFVKDGSIMFFCGALLGEASISVLQKEGISKSLNNFALIASLVLFFVIIIIYLIIQLAPKIITYETLYKTLVFFIAASFLLSFIFKFIYFNNKVKEQ
jgi:hypothetical protein